MNEFLANFWAVLMALKWVLLFIVIATGACLAALTPRLVTKEGDNNA